MSAEMVRIFIEYHVDMTRRVWDSINQITEEQFVAEDTYSRGSIRNLIVHITRIDERWLMGLKNLRDPNPDFKFEKYSTRSAARDYFDKIAAEMTEYVATLNDVDMELNPTNLPGLRWTILLHLANHGTDHRSTVLQKLHTLGAPTFDQDFIMWMWSKNELSRLWRT
jgi:uncharacterized damage-inducible protein DinB